MPLTEAIIRRRLASITSEFGTKGLTVTLRSIQNEINDQIRDGLLRSSDRTRLIRYLRSEARTVMLRIRARSSSGNSSNSSSRSRGITRVTIDNILSDSRIRTERELANRLRTVINSIRTQVRNRTLTQSEGNRLLNYARNAALSTRNRL